MNYTNQGFVFIVSVAIAAFVFFLGLLVYFSNRRTLTNKFFVGLTTFAFLWIVSLIFYFNVSRADILLVAGRLTFVSATWLAFFVLVFSYYFPKPNNYSLRIIFFLLISGVMFLISTSHFIIEDVQLTGNGYENVYGLGLTLFIIYFSAYLLLGIFNIVSKRKSLNTSERQQTDYILIGLAFSSFFGILTNLAIPTILGNDASSQFGPLSVTFFIATTSYAILRHKLFDIKIIVIQFTAVISVVSLFIKFLLSQNLEQRGINGFLLFVVCFFVVLLIRSTLRDIKDREHIEQLGKDLVVANEQLRQMDKQKSDFVSIASHQLRTPLTAIKGYSSLILEGSYGEIPQGVKDAMSKVFESSQRMVMIVENFLTISRIERGSMFYRFETLDLQDIVKKMVGEMRPVAYGYGLKIRFSENADRVYLVRADIIKIKQVVHNLINDAIGHTPKGFIEVSLSLSQYGDSITLAISDTGEGAAPSELKRIFEKYEPEIQTSGIRKETGVELFIVKEIIKAHQGKIWAESEGIGKGLTFFVELPAVKKTHNAS